MCVGDRSALPRIHADLTGSVEIISRLSEKGLNVAASAVCVANEDCLSARRCLSEKTPLLGLRCRDCELIEVKSCELRRDQVRLSSSIARATLRRDRILLCIVEPRVEECT